MSLVLELVLVLVLDLVLELVLVLVLELVLDLVLDLVLGVAFWRHFAVLTIIQAVRHIQDHLFLVREGSRYRKSWKFKVMLLRRVFETGSMAGLMTVLW